MMGVGSNITCITFGSHLANSKVIQVKLDPTPIILQVSAKRKNRLLLKKVIDIIYFFDPELINI
jgi:hypothetical protein